MTLQFQIQILLLTFGLVASGSCPTNAPCQNDGTCNVKVNGLTECLCKNGFTGPICNINCNEKALTCPTGFKMIPADSGKCYHFSTSETGSFWKAQKYCRDIHPKTSLWEPESIDNLMFVTLQGDASATYWSGIIDAFEERSPITVGTGTDIKTSVPEMTILTNADIGECVYSSSYHLYYGKCSHLRRSICQIMNPCKLPTVPVLPAPRKL